MEMTRMPFSLKLGGKYIMVVAPAIRVNNGAQVEKVGYVAVEEKLDYDTS
jgi:hypothetical protein